MMEENKMKKMLATLLTVCMLLSLAVFTGAAAETTETTIEFWHGMSSGLQTALVALTDKFNEENDMGITVNLTNQGGYTDLSTKLLGAIASDTLPDMSQVYNSYIASSLDVVVPLDDFIANDFDNYEDILSGYRAEGAEFGPIYTIAFNKSVQIYYYNKDLYEELGLTPPTTWQELYDVSKAIYEATGNAAFGYDDLFGMFLQYMLQNGAGYVEDGQVVFNNEKGVEAMTFLLDLFSLGYARTAGEDRYLSGPFNNGLIAAYIGSSAGAAYVNPVDFEYGASIIPVGEYPAAMQAGTNLAMFTQDATKQAAVWEYIKFLTSTESTVYWAMNTGYLPIRESGFESEDYQAFMETSAVAQAAYEQADNQAFEYAFPGSQEMRTALGTAMETAILEGWTAEETIDYMAEAAQEILDRQ